jgi:hypothetical protein
MSATTKVGRYLVGALRSRTGCGVALVRYYNEERPHSGRYCYGKTPLQTFREAKHLAEEKMLDRQMPLWGQTSDRREAGVAAVG